MLLEKQTGSIVELTSHLLLEKKHYGAQEDQSPHGHRPAGSISSGEELPKDFERNIKIISSQTRADGTVMHHVAYTGKDGKRYATVIEMPPQKAAAVSEMEKIADATGSGEFVAQSTVVKNEPDKTTIATEDTHKEKTIDTPEGEETLKKMSAKDYTRLFVNRFLMGVKNRNNPDNTIVDKNGQIKDRNLDDGAAEERESAEPELDTKDYLFGKFVGKALDLPVIGQMLRGAAKIVKAGTHFYRAFNVLAQFYKKAWNAGVASAKQTTLGQLADYVNGKGAMPQLHAGGGHRSSQGGHHGRVSHHGSRGGHHGKFYVREIETKAKLSPDFLKNAKPVASGKTPGGPSYTIWKNGKQTAKGYAPQEFKNKSGHSSSADEMFQNMGRVALMSGILGVSHLVAPTVLTQDNLGNAYALTLNDNQYPKLDSREGKALLKGMNSAEITQLLCGRYLMGLSQRADPQNTIVMGNAPIDIHLFHGLTKHTSKVYGMNTKDHVLTTATNTKVHLPTVKGMIANAQRAVKAVQGQFATKADHPLIQNISRRATLLSLATQKLEEEQKAQNYTPQRDSQHTEVVSSLRSHTQKEPSGAASQHGISASQKDDDDGEVFWRHFALLLNEMAASIPDKELDEQGEND